MLSRRHLLSAGTFGVVSMALPRMAFAAERSDIVIIGAGLAGLHAAQILKDLGMTVTVLEANDRVGGRV